MPVGTDFFIGVTDNAWFSYLSNIRASEVNFWRPSGLPFKALQPGGLFLFKLHAPLNFIAGGGFFATSTQVSIRQAWDWFETANGYGLFDSFLKRVAGTPADPGRTITCILLGEVFYFPRDLWIPAPDSFHLSTQVGKGYRVADEPGF